MGGHGGLFEPGVSAFGPVLDGLLDFRMIALQGGAEDFSALGIAALVMLAPDVQIKLPVQLLNRLEQGHVVGGKIVERLQPLVNEVLHHLSAQFRVPFQ